MNELNTSCSPAAWRASSSFWLPSLNTCAPARIRPLHGGVSFYGTAAVAQRVCLWSRLASRITLVVRRVNAGDASLLYEGIRRIPWHEVIAPGASIAVHAHGMNDELRNTHFTELKVKDGICDALRERTGARPNVDSADPDASIDVRVRENRATISLDLSGESLYARAYLEPDAGQDAPLECALSAGALGHGAVGRVAARRRRWWTRRAATARWWWKLPAWPATWRRAWRAAAGALKAGRRSTRTRGSACSTRPTSVSRKAWSRWAALARPALRRPTAPTWSACASWALARQARPSRAPARALSARGCDRWSASKPAMRTWWRT